MMKIGGVERSVWTSVTDAVTPRLAHFDLPGTFGELLSRRAVSRTGQMDNTPAPEPWPFPRLTLIDARAPGLFSWKRNT
jgi:hypothetical protein